MEFISALSDGAIAGIVIGCIAGVVIIGFLWYVLVKNSFVVLRNDVEEAFSAMDVHMKKRYDLIPNLVETVKGYSKHESETLTKVIRARNNCVASSGEGRLAAEKELASSLHTFLNVVQEQYPQLKADAQFLNLTNQLEAIEHEIAQSRKYYNAKVKLYNIKIEKFPSSIVANKMGLERKPFFEIENTAERVAPRVSFDDSPRARL